MSDSLNSLVRKTLDSTTSYYYLLGIIIAFYFAFTIPAGIIETSRFRFISSSIPLAILLLNISMVDAQRMVIPLKICYLGIFIGFIVNLIPIYIIEIEKGNSAFIEYLSACFLSLICMEGLSKLSFKYLRKEVLGLGDAKLFAMGGAWLGIKGVVTAIALSFIFAGAISLVGLISGKLKPLQTFPFAPFISIGIWGAWLTGPSWWWHLWQNLLGH